MLGFKYHKEIIGTIDQVDLLKQAPDQPGIFINSRDENAQFRKMRSVGWIYRKCCRLDQIWCFKIWRREVAKIYVCSVSGEGEKLANVNGSAVAAFEHLTLLCRCFSLFQENPNLTALSANCRDWERSSFPHSPCQSYLRLPWSLWLHLCLGHHSLPVLKDLISPALPPQNVKPQSPLTQTHEF